MGRWCVFYWRSVFVQSRAIRYCLGVGIGLEVGCLTGIWEYYWGRSGTFISHLGYATLLTSWNRQVGIFRSTMPASFVSVAQWQHYGQFFTNTGVKSLSQFGRRLRSHPGVCRNAEVCVAISCFTARPRWTWENVILASRNLYWCGLAVIYQISIMGTKLPWYVLPFTQPLPWLWELQLTSMEFARPAFYPRAWVCGSSGCGRYIW